MGISKPSKTLDTSNAPRNNLNKKNRVHDISASTNSLAGKSASDPDAQGDTSTAAAKVAANKMPVDLYYLPPSAPCRTVMMVAKAIGLDLNLKTCNVMQGDHLKPEYLKMNPQHTIPTMNDNGFIIWESRAIAAYLVSQYAKNDSLYPKEPRARALVDHRLYFDSGTLFPRTGYYTGVIFKGLPQTPEKLKELEEAVGWFNTMLEGHEFAAGDQLTIADISLIVTVSNIDVFGFDLTPYDNVVAWYAKTKQALAPYGYEEINQSGANTLGEFYKAKIAKT